MAGVNIGGPERDDESLKLQEHRIRQKTKAFVQDLSVLHHLWLCPSRSCCQKSWAGWPWLKVWIEHGP